MIAIGSDHAGYETKLAVIKHLQENGYETEDKGCYNTDSCDYPLFAKKVAHAVADKEAEFGILICGTGIGMSIAANKVKGIRASVVSDKYSTKMTREHNDANILCMGARVIDIPTALRLADIFLTTPFSNGENHVRRISQLED